jgi:hypothetical protein
MNIFDDMRKTEHEHLWILKKDGTVFCYDCGEINDKK